jgi:hypothetical protein
MKFNMFQSGSVNALETAQLSPAQRHGIGCRSAAGAANACNLAERAEPSDSLSQPINPPAYE